MEIAHTAAGVALVVLLGSSADAIPASGLDRDRQPVVVVRLDNLAGVRPDHLKAAKERASAIFGRIAVRIAWVDQEQTVRERVRGTFTVVVVNADKEGGRASAFADALGLANPSVRRAHVFYDRVAALNVGTARPIPSLLGDVIAHELGHLLLAPPGHSPSGIMRAELERSSWALRTFTSRQKGEMLARLARAAIADAPQSR
jgi:hypothetical protein